MCFKVLLCNEYLNFYLMVDGYKGLIISVFQCVINEEVVPPKKALWTLNILLKINSEFIFFLSTRLDIEIHDMKERWHRVFDLTLPLYPFTSFQNPLFFSPTSHLIFCP